MLLVLHGHRFDRSLLKCLEAQTAQTERCRGPNDGWSLRNIAAPPGAPTARHHSLDAAIAAGRGAVLSNDVTRQQIGRVMRACSLCRRAELR